MHPFFAMTMLFMAIGTPPFQDEDEKTRAVFAEIARRAEREVEKIGATTEKANALYDLARYREQAKDFEGAKRALAQALDLLPSFVPPKEQVKRVVAPPPSDDPALPPIPTPAARMSLLDDEATTNFFLLTSIADAQDRLNERVAAAATLVRARDAVVNQKNDFFKIDHLRTILKTQREHDDREAVAETVQRATSIIKTSKDSLIADTRFPLLLEFQAASGDARRALQALLDTPVPDDFEQFREDESRKESFRVSGLEHLVVACRAEDDDVLVRIAKLTRQISEASSRNSLFHVLAIKQTELKHFEEAVQTAANIDLTVNDGIKDPRHEAIECFLGLAEGQIENHDKAGAELSTKKAIEIFESFEKVKDRTHPDLKQFLRLPLSRLCKLLARVGERDDAFHLLEKMPLPERVHALKDIAEIDEFRNHRDGALAARKKALETAEAVVIEANSPNAEGDIEAQKHRRDQAMRAIISLRVRMGELPKALDLIRNAGEARDPLTYELIGPLGCMGDTTTAFAQIDSISEPKGKLSALDYLASGINHVREGKKKYQDE